jgi:hypothetical protein
MRKTIDSARELTYQGRGSERRDQNFHHLDTMYAKEANILIFSPSWCPCALVINFLFIVQIKTIEQKIP